MTNAELFKKVFGIYAEEFWAYPEEKMLDWITSDAQIADVVERKKGKWIKNDGRYGWRCSECGVDDLYAYLRNAETGQDELQDRFCPNCGAEMEGSDADNSTD